jgi:hypothetical protein
VREISTEPVDLGEVKESLQVSVPLEITLPSFAWLRISPHR